MTEPTIDPAQMQAAIASIQNMANAQVGTVVREAMAVSFRHGVDARDARTALDQAEEQAKAKHNIFQGVINERDALSAQVLELEKVAEAKSKKKK